MWIEELKRELTGRVLDIWRGHDDNGKSIDLPAEKQEAYRKLWREQGGQPTTESSPNHIPCRHLGNSPIQRNGCGSCQAKWVYPCELYGKCSPFGYHAGVKRCEGCVHYATRNSEKEEPSFRRLVLIYECSPGDALVMSAAVESLHRAHPGKFVTAVEGTATEFFDHNPHIVTALDEIDGMRVEWQRICIQCPFVNHGATREADVMQRYCDYLAGVLGVPVPLAVSRPCLYLSPEERARIPQVHEVAGSRPRYWLVNAGSEYWELSDYQRLVNLLHGKVLFVQVGDVGQTQSSLQGVLDMRGQTDLRALARMAFHAVGGVGPPVLLLHMCAAFEKPYVCITEDGEQANAEFIRPEQVAAQLISPGT